MWSAVVSVVTSASFNAALFIGTTVYKAGRWICKKTEERKERHEKSSEADQVSADNHAAD